MNDREPCCKIAVLQNINSNSYHLVCVHAQLCLTLHKAHQASLFIEFSRQEYWHGFLFPTPGELAEPGIEPWSLASPAFSSVAQSCPTLCDPMNRSTPGLPVHHQLLEFTHTYIHWVGDAIQPSHPLSSPSPPSFNLSQQQGLFKWVITSYEVAKVLAFQLQHQSFQWTLRTDLL